MSEIKNTNPTINKSEYNFILSKNDAKKMHVLTTDLLNKDNTNSIVQNIPPFPSEKNTVDELLSISITFHGNNNCDHSNTHRTKFDR